MPKPAAVGWRSLIDDVLLRRLTDYAIGVPAVRTVYLTGSYVRGMWNPDRPNVNVYFVVDHAHTAEVRAGLAEVFSQVRTETRNRGVDFLVDCHPFTISQRDEEWGSVPLLTLTTKVFDASRLPERLGVSPTIGFGWWLSNRILHGGEDDLAVFEVPPPRSEAWFRGAYAALSHYRAVLDHLPWAIDPPSSPRLVPGGDVSVRRRGHQRRGPLRRHRRGSDLRSGYSDPPRLVRRGPGLLPSSGTVPKVAGPSTPNLGMKAAVLDGEAGPSEAMAHRRDAVRVWDVVWSQYTSLARSHGMPDDLLRILTWM